MFRKTLIAAALVATAAMPASASTFNGVLNGWYNGAFNGWTNGSFNGAINGIMNGAINGTMNGAINGITPGQTTDSHALRVMGIELPR